MENLKVSGSGVVFAFRVFCSFCLLLLRLHVEITVIPVSNGHAKSTKQRS